jgi:hypothetical protein
MSRGRIFNPKDLLSISTNSENRGMSLFIGLDLIIKIV